MRGRGRGRGRVRVRVSVRVRVRVRVRVTVWVIRFEAFAAHLKARAATVGGGGCNRRWRRLQP